MRYAVVYNVFCWIFLLFESLLTETSKVRRIIGGRDADENKYQYVVRLQAQIIESDTKKTIHEEYHRCTAAVLTSTWTLTGAHCQDTKDLEILLHSENKTFRHVVIYGSHTISLVMDIITHPAYNIEISEVHNDVALMRHEPITLNQYARLSGLDYVTMIGQEVTLVGYGTTNGTNTINGKLYHVADDATSLGKPLQVLDALIVPCGVLNSDIVITPSMCLARRCNKLSGICPGDSGGPVLHESGVVGINSVGPAEMTKFCYLEPYTKFYDPAGITPTSPYIDWISSIIRNEVPKYYIRK